MEDEIQFAALLRPELVIHGRHARDREEALRKMARHLVTRGYCREPFVRGILDREEVHPSALPMEGLKIAIPHTDSTYVIHPALLFARLREPVEFRSMGAPSQRLSVAMIAMFALKEKTWVGDLLETLITVFQEPSTLEALYHAEDKGVMFNILQGRIADISARKPE